MGIFCIGYLQDVFIVGGLIDYGKVSVQKIGNFRNSTEYFFWRPEKETRRASDVVAGLNVTVYYVRNWKLLPSTASTLYTQPAF